jgi:hypothetical protein
MVETEVAEAHTRGPRGKVAQAVLTLAHLVVAVQGPTGMSTILLVVLAVVVPVAT